MPTPVLLSRSLDPILGIFTGVFAFYLHQTNPRTAPPSGESLKDLIYWKKEKWLASRTQISRNEKETELEAALETLLKKEEGSSERAR